MWSLLSSSWSSTLFASSKIGQEHKIVGCTITIAHRLLRLMAGSGFRKTTALTQEGLRTWAHHSPQMLHFDKILVFVYLQDSAKNVFIFDGTEIYLHDY